jgi:hypothetical protein
MNYLSDALYTIIDTEFRFTNIHGVIREKVDFRCERRYSTDQK